MIDLDSLVDPDRGLVSARIFQDEEIYRMEQEKIFGRCWLYLAHESQIPNPGDYVAAKMGEDPIIVTRGQDGKVHAFLNACRHRGAKVCRSDSGTSKAFRCPFHGWTYSCEGELVGVPRYKEVYFEELDKSKWGLVPVTKVDSVYGLIFGTWDPNAPTLQEYLGDMLFYLDLMFNRAEGGVEVIGGVHKWVIPTNWKIPAENFGGDHYHLLFTHGSGIQIKARDPLSNNGFLIFTPEGHSCGQEFAGAQRGEAVNSEYNNYIAEIKKRVAEQKGEVEAKLTPIGVGTIFPNLSFMDTMRFRTIRLWQPLGPNKIEVNSWCVVDKNMSDELKQIARRGYQLTFGPNGMFELDDGEVWMSITEAIQGYKGRTIDFNYQMGMGHEISAEEFFGKKGIPGTMNETFMHEGTHRNYYRRWKQLMMS